MISIHPLRHVQCPFLLAFLHSGMQPRHLAERLSEQLLLHPQPQFLAYMHTCRSHPCHPIAPVFPLPTIAIPKPECIAPHCLQNFLPYALTAILLQQADHLDLN